MFSFCYVPFTMLTKSVDRWTSNENSFNFIISFYLIPFKILTKTCGQVDKQWKFLKKIQPYMFYCLNVWTRMCLSISCFLSVMSPSQCWQKVWTGGQVMKILKKRSNMFYFYFLKVWTFVQEAVFLFHIFFLSFLYPSFFLQKSVDRWTSKKNSEKKHQSPLSYCLTCGQNVFFLFLILLLFCTPSPRVTRILVQEKTRVMRKPRNTGTRCIVYTVYVHSIF